MTVLENQDKLKALMARIKEKDTKALEELYEETKSSVYGFALSILKNKFDAEDILQSVYVQLWHNIDKYSDKGKPMAWILTLTRNLSMMKIRESKKIEGTPETFLERAAAKEDVHQEVENKSVLDTALKALSEEEREIVMLHAVSDFKFREIAQMLDLALPTVLSKYNRAIKKMRKLLEE